MAASPSRDRVTARFAQLRDAYEDFEVQQTTVRVDEREYEDAVGAFGGVARADVRVRNEDGEVLSVCEGDGWREPGTEVGASEPIADAACEAVHEATGVRPTVRTLDRVAIVSITGDGPDQPPVYRLHLRFEADVDAGTPGEGTAWRTDPPGTDWL
jgi:ADP-ribose pyrophosphatase YjhB (NUDIX family)